MRRAWLAPIIGVALGLVAGVALVRTAGATDLALTVRTACLDRGTTWVEWTVHNPTPVPFTVTGGSPSWPTEIAAGASATAVQIVPPGPRPLEVWADIVGYWQGYPGDAFYQPDTDGRLAWSEGQPTTLTEATCAFSGSTDSTTTTVPTTTTTTTACCPAGTSGSSLPPNSTPLAQPHVKDATTSTTVWVDLGPPATFVTASVTPPPSALQLAETGSRLTGFALGLAFTASGALLLSSRACRRGRRS